MSLKMKDFNEAERQARLKEMAEFVDSIEDRLAQSKEFLGDRYLLHPANRVVRRVRPYGGAR